MDQDQTVDAGTQAAPATTQVEADTKLRNECAAWRVKCRGLEEQLTASQTEAGALRTQYADYDAMKTQATTSAEQIGALTGQVQSASLDARLRTELATLGVTDSSKQDILIRAAGPDLAVTYDDKHQAVGDVAPALKSLVDTLGLGQAPATAPVEDKPAQEAAAPAPITVTPDGPLTKTQVMASRQAALDRQRQGLPPR